MTDRVADKKRFIGWEDLKRILERDEEASEI